MLRPESFLVVPIVLGQVTVLGNLRGRRIRQCNDVGDEGRVGARPPPPNGWVSTDLRVPNPKMTGCAPADLGISELRLNAESVRDTRERTLPTQCLGGLIFPQMTLGKPM